MLSVGGGILLLSLAVFLLMKMRDQMATNSDDEPYRAKARHRRRLEY
jgi:hypothetical protein